MLDGRLLRYDRAGIGRYIWRLQEALAGLPQTDFDVKLLVDAFETKSSRSALPTKRVMVPARHGSERFLLPMQLRGASLVHWPDHGIPDGFGGPSIVTVHDLSFLTHPYTHSDRSLDHYQVAVRSLRKAEGVIAVSEYVRSRLLEKELANASRITVVPEAAGLPAVEFPNEERLWPTPFVLMVGTIQPRKNIVTACRAFSQSKFAREGRLLLVGSLGFSGSQIVRDVQSENPSGLVRFIGRVRDSVLARLFQQAEFVLVPSLDEGFGLSALESMSCATPVIAANAGALPELVGDGALLVDPEVTEDITAAIDRVASDSEFRMSLGERGRLRAQCFTWDRTARETLAVYRALV